jgi:hypothetical protein
MHKLFRSALTLFATLVFTGAASAGELVVRIAEGRATVIARDVTVAQILAEWARVGNTTVVNGEKVFGAPMSLELVDVPEKHALDVLLRSAAGYMTAPRSEHVPGVSMYDRVVILATSQAPVNPPPMAQPFNRPVVQQVLPQQPPPEDLVDDQGNPVVMDPAMMPQPGMVPPPGMAPPGMPYQVPPMGPGQVPGMPQGPVTAPTPGQLPQQPQAVPLLPYTPPGAPTQPGGTAPSGGPFMTPPPQGTTWPPPREQGGP